MDREALLALADRCEKAGADEQRAMLIEAFEAIHGPKPARLFGGSDERTFWFTRFNPFFHMLQANAFESAAMTLVPEGMQFGCGRDNIIPGPEGWARVSDYVLVRAATPALALTAACLHAPTKGQDHG